MLSNRLVVVLGFATCATSVPGSASAEPHRASFLASLGVREPMTLELAARPHERVELAVMYSAGSVYCDCDTDFLGPDSWERYDVERYTGVVRLVSLLTSERRQTRVLFHAGGGVGWEDGEKIVGSTPGLFGRLFGEEAGPETSTEIDGRFLRGDTGLTVERSVFRTRLIVGIAGRDPHAFVSLGFGLGF